MMLAVWPGGTSAIAACATRTLRIWRTHETMPLFVFQAVKGLPKHLAGWLSCTLVLTSLFCLQQVHAQTNPTPIEQVILKHKPAGSADTKLKHLNRQLLSEPNNGLLFFEYGLAFLESADTYHWEYLDQALDYFEKAIAHFPDNPYITMYRGRALGAKALDMEPSVLTRLRWAREAFKLMDQAVSKQPDSPILRLLRADAQLMAHPILRRSGKLAQDAEMIETWMVSPQFKTWPAVLQARFHLFLGCFLDKQGKSRQQTLSNWQLAADLDPGSKTAEEAKARIAGTWVELGFEGEDQ